MKLPLFNITVETQPTRFFQFVFSEVFAELEETGVFRKLGGHVATSHFSNRQILLPGAFVITAQKDKD